MHRDQDRSTDRTVRVDREDQTASGNPHDDARRATAREGTPAETDEVDVRAIGEVFGDERNLTLLRTLEQSDTAMTARELADAAGIPESTVYRRLDSIQETPIVRSKIALTKDHSQITKYDITADAVTFSFASDGLSADVTVSTTDDDP